MSYIIINGKSSKQVHGLLIQSLPPITKPQKRVEIEEIDGRDGDIITHLGFSAYDKPLQIGLYDSFDIDEIIDYFNSEGEIIFSSEADKIYKFQIIDQIDFNRLIRFRTATVNIHVQPFKYPAVEQPITFESETDNDFPIIFNKTIRNIGNYESVPIYTIKGQGNINIYIDGKKKLEFTLPSETTAIIDVMKMNLVDSNGNFLNRYAIGDYNNLRLKVGKNEVRITGDVSEIKIERFSRWV